MAVTKDKPAPYTAAAAILDVVGRFRDRGLPSPINAEVLSRAGVAEGLIARTLQALQTLDLIDKDGSPTKTLEGLRLAPQAEYSKRLEDWLKSAYAEIFSYVDPTQDDETRIRDAFRGYNPVGQQGRMVSLFIGLCAAAGLKSPKAATARPASIRSRAVSAPRRIAAAVGTATASRNPARKQPGLPPAIGGLLETLPSPEDGWTAADRAKFLKTFESVLDFSIPVVKEKKETAA
jgi:hypothetical protein